MHRTKQLIMWIGCLIAVIGIWVVIFFQVDYDRSQAQKSAEANTSNLAKAFEEHVLSTVRQIDSMLLMLRDDYQKNPKRFIEQIAIYKKHTLNDLIIQTSVIDANGILVFSEQPLPAVPLDLSDREHFKVHRDAGKDILFISKPVLGRVSKKWSIQFTRKIFNGDGTFGGVLVVSVDPEYFSSFYRSVDLGNNGVVTLVGTDRVIRARSNVEKYRSDAKGQTLPVNRPLFDLQKPAAGVYHLSSVTDGIDRTWAYRRLNEYPLIVTVGFTYEDVFSPVIARRNNLILWGTILSILVMIGTGMVRWFDQRQRQTEDKLRESENRYKSLVESSYDLIFSLNSGGIVTFVSAAWKTLLGYEVSDALGQDFRKFVHQDDIHLCDETISKAILTQKKQTSPECRILHADGSWRWHVSNITLLYHTDGSFNITGISRDISERKKLKDELTSKVAQLEAALAKVKQLEGIIPICSYCKKIRDDKESWHQMERYISEHSEVLFSHGICPECFAKLMIDFV